MANDDRILRILCRIAADIDELARARGVEDLATETVDADARLRLRHRLAEPPVEILRRGPSIKHTREALEWFENEHRRAGLPLPWERSPTLSEMNRSQI